jgi:SHS2 domain-containing protein
MRGYRLLEHTGDMGIEATGETLEELFAQAAYGMMEVITSLAHPSPREEKVVEVRGGDVGELLVNWLNEILFLFDPREFFPADFEIEEAGWQKVKARIRGEPFDPNRHPIEREIKAVTYHQLKVEKSNGQWIARVYVDI